MSYSDIFVNRIGTSDDSFMITTKLIDVFENNDEILTLSHGTLKREYKTNPILSEIPKGFFKNIPPYIIVKGDFIDQSKNSGEESPKNNILGKNSYFITGVNNINIPTADTCQETLSFYGAILIREGNSFKLDNRVQMPLFQVSIGKKYVSNYLLCQGYGDGFYIERHNTPHYHQPANIDCDGYLVLAKRIGNQLILSKFKIPFGSAIYTPPDIYHNDSFLIGDYYVIYTKTPDYNTYLFKSSDGKLVSVS